MEQKRIYMLVTEPLLRRINNAAAFRRVSKGEFCLTCVESTLEDLELKHGGPFPEPEFSAPAKIQETSALITAQQLAEMLGVTEAFLYDCRQKKTGPKFYKIGRCYRYSTADVNAWLAEVKSK